MSKKAKTITGSILTLCVLCSLIPPQDSDSKPTTETTTEITTLEETVDETSESTTDETIDETTEITIKEATEETTDGTPEETTEITTEQPTEEMVWISSKGKKYHSQSSCSNMKNPKEVTISKAKKKGYTPCKKCYQ